MIESGAYAGSLKVDGTYFRFIKDMNGDMAFQTRARGVDGEFHNKLESVPHLHSFFNSVPNGSCLLGELYLPANEISSAVTSIVGGKPDRAIAMQQTEETKLHYYVFDVWAWGGVSWLGHTAKQRLTDSILFNGGAPQNQYVTWAKYYVGEDLMRFLTDALDAGREGVVITKLSSIPEPGKRTARKTLKVKREIRETLDVLIIGTNPPKKEYTGKLPASWLYWYDTESDRLTAFPANKDTAVPVTKNYYFGVPGSLQIGVVRGNDIVQLGSLSGLPWDVLVRWEQYIGCVAEVTCMQVMETGGLRHPRFVQWRPDLSQEDCTWEKIYGDS